MNPKGECIDYVKIDANLFGIFLRDGEEGFVRFEPIPLTAKILEKNGFKCVDVYQVYERHTFGKHIELDYSEGMVCGISISVTDKNAVNTSNTDITRDRNIYIHELQHALRLCGLDDLADSIII